MADVGGSWVQLCYWESPTGYGSYVSQLRLIAYSTQSVANNTSTVHFKWQKSITGGSAYWNDSHAYGVSFAGNYLEFNFAFGTVSSTSWVDCAGEKTMTVSHNDDGTKSGTMSCSGYKMWESVEGSASITLPTIARASKPTAAPNPITIDDLGNTLVVYTNRKSSTFTHTIKVQCGAWSWTSSARSVGTSVNVTIPYSVIAQFSATSKTASATVTCTTFNGTTQIGSAQTCSVTFQINPNRDHPNVGTVTLSEGNARVASIVATANTFVQGISTLEVSAPITVSGSYTQLDKVTVANGGDNKTYTLSGTSGTLNYSCANNRTTWLTITAYDKRGTTAVSKPAWTLLPYAPITMTASVGRVSATGSTATGQISGVAYGGDYGQSTNSLTVTYRWKLHDSTTWTDGLQTYTLPISGSGQTNYSHAITFSESFDYQYQYDIEFTANDLFSTAVYTCQLMQGLPILSWDETEVDVFGNLHIHDREDPYVWQDVIDGFDGVLEHNGQKNLLPMTRGTQTNNGITYTVASDGTVTVNGTATADSWFIVADTAVTDRLPTGFPVTLSGCPSGGSYGTYRLQFWQYDGTSIASDFGEGVTVTASAGVTMNVAIFVWSGVTVSNLVFKPMLRDARIASNSYVPNRYDYSGQMTFSGSNISCAEKHCYVIGNVCTVYMRLIGSFSSSTWPNGGTKTFTVRNIPFPSVANVTGMTYNGGWGIATRMSNTGAGVLRNVGYSTISANNFEMILDYTYLIW